MNRTALSVIGLAVGAVLIIGLFNIYKPAVSHVAHDVFQKVHIGQLGLKEHKYGDLYYTDDGHGNIDFTHGTLTKNETTKWDYNTGLLYNAHLKNVKSVKFDDVKVSPDVQSIRGMFSFNNTLQSVDFGSNFDTSHIVTNRVPYGKNNENFGNGNYGWGYASMFQGDPNLTTINFGKGLHQSQNPNASMYTNMFDGSPKLKNISGNVSPMVQTALQHLTNPYP